jgi:hypothetical protein
MGDDDVSAASVRGEVTSSFDPSSFKSIFSAEIIAVSLTALMLAEPNDSSATAASVRGEE